MFYNLMIRMQSFHEFDKLHFSRTLPRLKHTNYHANTACLADYGREDNLIIQIIYTNLLLLPGSGFDSIRLFKRRKDISAVMDVQ